jgi:hypothetical protein
MAGQGDPQGPERQIIIYAWINDELTLRKRGANTDVYQMFQGMLEAGNSHPALSTN